MSRPGRGVVAPPTIGGDRRFARTEKFAGTRVTESYEVVRPDSRLGWLVIGRLYGCRDWRGELRSGMQQTLEWLRAAAEVGAATGADRAR